VIKNISPFSFFGGEGGGRGVHFSADFRSTKTNQIKRDCQAAKTAAVKIFSGKWHIMKAALQNT
jgi:hypothetical protein